MASSLLLGHLSKDKFKNCAERGEMLITSASRHGDYEQVYCLRP